MPANTKGKDVDAKTEKLIRDEVSKWVEGDCPKFNWIRVKDLDFNSRYRVDVFSKDSIDGLSIMSKHWISHSYFVEVTEFGTVVDRTVAVENPRWGT